MPKRSDIQHILVIGSGPIVIGQACEFDYSGTQACRVLREEGFRVSLVNSNPATIMTDPEFADATYIEPLLPEYVEKVLATEAELGHPVDALLATLGGQTALNLAVVAARAEDPAQARGRAHRRRHRRHPARRGSTEVQGDRPQDRRRCTRLGRLPHPGGGGFLRGHRGKPGRHPAVIHHGRPGLGHGPQRRGGTGAGRSGPGRQPGARGAGRRERARLEGVRARTHARPQRQRGRRLLDRERRPDGRAHRRLDHRRAGDDPDRPRIPADARRRHRGAARGRRRHRWLQHPVRHRSALRPDDRDRDEPAGFAIECFGLQGNRLPDRQDRGQAGGRLHPGRGQQRHHPGHPGLLRAGPGLRGGQGAAVRVREVPGRRPGADHPHEVGRRGDGHRA